MMAEPPAKRLKTAPSAGGKAAADQGRRTLRQTLLVVLFLVRVNKSTDTVTVSLARIGTMVQRNVEQALAKYHQMFVSKLECLEGQIQGLRNEVTQLTRLCSNRHADQQIRLEPNQEHVTASGSKRHMHLRFLNNLKPPIYTEKKLTDKNKAAIKVAMFEGDNMITSGPFSKVKVEILVLRGDFAKNGRDDWTTDEFDKHIAHGRDGQDLVLGTVWLNRGEVELSRICFKEGSCRRDIIMGARVSKNEKIAGQVREAITNPVRVLDRRSEGNEKSHPPRLDDAVYRLEGIAKDRIYHKCLEKENIHTVEDLLKFLNKDSEMLCEILQMKSRPNSWLKLITHAAECILEERPGLKRYQCEEGNLVLFFNCVHDLVGAEFPGGYAAREGFDASQKASVNKWKRRAYDKLEDIPLDPVMKDNDPCLIPSITDAAAGPSVLAEGSPQSNFCAERFAAFQGTGAAENSPHSAINHVTPPMYPSAGDDLIITNPGYMNVHDYQDQGTALFVQQPMDPGSTLSGYQQNPATVMDHTTMIASTSGAQLQAGQHLGDSSLYPPSSLPGGDSCCCFGMDALRPWCPEHGQPNCSPFPGSGPSDGCS